MESSVLSQAVANGISLSLFYILISVGLTLLYGMANILFTAHGVTYMLGAVTCYFLVVKAGIPWVLAVVIVAVAFALMGPVFERVFFRRVRHIGTSTLVVSLGLLFLLEGAGYSFFGLRAHAVPSGFSGALSLLGARLTYERIVMLAGSVILLVGLQWFLTRTKYGVAMRASVQNKTGALLQGISDNGVAMMAFALGMGLAGAAGALVAPIYNVSVPMYMEATLWPFLIMGVGGLGSIPGCIIAAFCLGFLQSFVATFIGPVIAQLAMFSLITVFIAVRPQGIMGEERNL